MRKVLLSLTTIASFVLYSLYARQQVGNSASTKSGVGIASGTPRSSSTMTRSSGGSLYKDGGYTGSVEDVFYGDIQVRATIAQGRISAIEFLKYPNDQKTSVVINTDMMPILIREAIESQSAKVDIVSGATDSSEGFRRSLADALGQAK